MNRKIAASSRCLLSIVLIALTGLCFASDDERSRAVDRPSTPTVVLAYDGSGDFGPETPNTNTAGWQEAIDYCVEHKRDLYVKGGWGGQTAIYHVSTTIRIPASQDFRIDGGEYVVNWQGPGDEDLLVVDSGMDCHYRFGILVYGGAGAALRIKPGHPVPIDRMVVFVDSQIEASSIADPHPFQRGERKGGAGVVFDTAEGAICHAEFHFTAVLNFATCIETPSSGAAFAYNRLDCMHLHTNADNSTLLRLGSQSAQNVLRLGVGVDQGATGVKGIDVFGARNTLQIITRGGFPRGNDLVFEEPAEGNQVNLLHGRDAFEPLALITDRAAKPTNQVTWTGGPPPIRRIEADAGTFVYTQRLYPAMVRVVGGEVSELALVRGADSLDCGTSRPREILMSVGDQLKINSAQPPTLEIVPLKVR